MSVVISWVLTIFARWNYRFRTLLLNLFNQRISVIASVSNHSLRLFANEQSRGLGDIVHLSTRERKL